MPSSLFAMVFPKIQLFGDQLSEIPQMLFTVMLFLEIVLFLDQLSKIPNWLFVIEFPVMHLFEHE